jgi:hypothetical protein
MQAVNQNGAVLCSDPFAPKVSVLNPDISEILVGASETIASVDGVSFVNDCTSGADARLLVVAEPGNAANVFSDSHSLGFVDAGTLDGNNPPNNFVTVATTTGSDRGEVNVGLTTGPNDSRTVSISFYVTRIGTDCQIGIDGIAG